MSDYIALYRKYRPSVFSDVIGQDHITKVLRSEISGDKVSHAYLFCGSRGTGKTTCAKILAKAISCENLQNGDPCGKCEKCVSFDTSFDIVEMDAASNNGVDNIRDLREKINFLPIEMKKRVYIIDEVHMLSQGAFNALLKTLEEPPAHVTFILATTELNKIPATILSRCKRFDFHRISPEDMLPRLRQISDAENIGITDDALMLIARLATGAMRDALSMLELFVGQKDITREKAVETLGVVGNSTVLELVRAISEKDCPTALSSIQNAYLSSKDMGIVCSELGEMFRNLLIMKYASSNVSTLINEGNDVISVLRECEDKFSPERLLYCTDIIEETQNKLSRNGLSRKALIEIMIMRLCDSNLSTQPSSLLERISALERGGFASAPVQNKTAPKPTSKPMPEKKETPTKQDIQDAPFDIDAPFDFDGLTPPPEDNNFVPEPPDAPSDTQSKNYGGTMLAFGEVLEEIKNTNMMLYSMIADASAFLDGDNVTLKVNPIGVFMLTSDKSLHETIQNICCAKLGYNINLTICARDESKNSSSDLDL